ncbi:acyl carrier protein [Nonomuraea sp. NPDC059023]|uniref:acyl carrier protein n=1 Tax=unclassified Nonomuraea TaxID=2593643 RepID=UPI0036783CE9
MQITWDERFEAAIAECLPDGVVADGLEPDVSLVDLGLDSISMINLAARLEDEYQLALPDDLVTFTTFATPAALWETIRELRAQP